MKNQILIFLFALALLPILLIPAATAYVTPDSIVAGGNVYVSNVTYDPGTFFTGDSGTVTFAVTNGNANQSIVANHASFGDDNFQLTSGTYDTSSNIGPLQTRMYIFSVVSDSKEGVYYPTFSLSLRDADSLFYQGMVRIDNTPLIATVLSKPDSFTQAKKDTIAIQLANPRRNDVKNVLMCVSGGPGADLLPSTQYIGKVASGTSMMVNFSVTPGQETTLNLTVEYDNGDNHHSTGLQIPVTFSRDKKSANPVMSNIEAKTESGITHITGDVTNAGLTVANAVTVTVLSPAVQQDPYKYYVIGALKPDDFGSFEVTFTSANSTSIPIQLSYKDTDGNIITSTQNVTVPLFADSAQAPGFPVMPVAAIVLVLVIFGGGWIIYLRRYKQ